MGTSPLDASSISLLVSESMASVRRELESEVTEPTGLSVEASRFPYALPVDCASFILYLHPSSAARVSAANAADSAWCNCCSISAIRAVFHGRSRDHQLRDSQQTSMKHSVAPQLCGMLFMCEGHPVCFCMTT